jgi:hypothetical protein
MPIPPVLIKLTKPELKLTPGIKLKAFVWKRIILDKSNQNKV